ncbi:hypothetical protein BGZ96_012292 [Linnemannia gamsii]|uniref:phosphatidate phosphatase n=1 Tax=Linnemannia gamsii TaxID=64522 RepID=A0ABQ7JR06_9FUNG|nr:hypothetical protein BGZ96_012292 [Linnemannia gamsii]
MYSVGSFFSTVSKFYSEINPATLSGAIDIVVVQQANGDLACSPFHVRFGKLSVLRPQEKVVEVRVNGTVIAFPMKVGDAGEAFFVLETDDYVPDEFATSPIAGPADESDLTPVDYFDLSGHPHSHDKQKQKQLEGAVNGQYPNGEEDALLDNGYVSAASGHGSAFEESLRDDSDRESILSTSERIMDEPARMDPFQGMPGSFSQSHGPLQEPESPTPSKSISKDNHQIPYPRDTIDPTVNALFPAVVREESTSTNNAGTLTPEQKSSRAGRRRSEVLFDMTGYKTDSCTESSDDDDDLPRGILSDSERHNHVFRKRFSRTRSHLSKEQRQQLVEDIKQGAFLKPEETLANTQLERQKSRNQRKKKRAGIAHGSEGRKGRKRANSMPSIGEPDIPFPGLDTFPEKHRETVAKKDAVTVEKMPKRTARPNVMSDTEMEYETNKPATSTRGEGWAWGWGTLPVKQDNPDEDDEVKEDTSKPLIPEEPVEIETREFQMGSTKCHVALSLCGEDDFGKDAVASHKAFQSAQLTFETFSKDPAAVLADKKLVCYIDGRFYSWANAVPQLAALLFFHQPLSDNAASGTKDQKPAAEDRPSSTRFGTISRWFRKTPAGTTAASTPDLGSAASALPANETDGAAVDSQDPEVRLLNPALRSKSLPPLDTSTEEHAHSHVKVPALSEKDEAAVPDTKRYAKTLRLTSEQLQTLGLKKGANTVSFSVTSSYQGTATCVAKIFLWDHDSQVVISDIDGTITKSDALGHIFAMAGRDWTHLGVAKLFTDIRSNGYHILYLTSRAIGQADYTRKYLQKVEQNSYQLPDGPVIMSPDRLFSAFHREVIIRKPEVFKMACLRDVKKLFGDRNPFYAGFGNRITDALSYRSVNVPPSRIFTIDSYGEVKLELLSAFKSSYLALNDLVNEIFPGQRVAPEFNDWNFWKSDLPRIELPDLPLSTNTYGTSGSSSLLSSTTSVAKKVVSLTHSSSSSSLLQPSSPTSPAVDTKSKQLTYERNSYTGSFRGRADNWTSDDEHAAEQQQAQEGQLTEDGSRRVRATSPSMLSAFVPTRLIRAVRSGSTSSAATPLPQSLAPLSPTQSAQAAADESDRPVSISLPTPVDGLLQTDDDVAKASQKSLEQGHRENNSSRPNSVNLDDLLPVKQEEDDGPIAGLVPEGVVEEEEEYEGDYEDGEDGEEYGDEEDEDDEYLDDIEEGLEEPFL